MSFEQIGSYENFIKILRDNNYNAWGSAPNAPVVELYLNSTKLYLILRKYNTTNRYTSLTIYKEDITPQKPITGHSFNWNVLQTPHSDCLYDSETKIILFPNDRIALSI